MVIPGVSSTQQTVQLAGGDTVYRADPIADIPSGFVLATNGPRFRAATPDQQRDALAALVALQNPSLHGTDDTQCIGCHLATYLTARRAGPSGVDPRALPGWFASTRARAVRTIADEDPRVVRAFGWAWITQSGEVSTLRGGFEQVRGIACDDRGKRLFVIDHSLTVGLPDKLRVISLPGS
jgi:hypothetical protein